MIGKNIMIDNSNNENLKEELIDIFILLCGF